MPKFHLDITEEEHGEIEKMAREAGITVDELISSIVSDYFRQSNKITRWPARRVPNSPVRRDSTS